MKFAAIVFAFAVGLASPAEAVEPSEVLADPVLEKRARSVERSSGFT